MSTDSKEPLNIPRGTEISISGARFTVGGYDTNADAYECFGRKEGRVRIKRHLVEEAFADTLASGTRQIHPGTGKQRFLRTNTNSDEEATEPKS